MLRAAPSCDASSSVSGNLASVPSLLAAGTPLPCNAPGRGLLVECREPPCLPLPPTARWMAFLSALPTGGGRKGSSSTSLHAASSALAMASRRTLLPSSPSVVPPCNASPMAALVRRHTATSARSEARSCCLAASSFENSNEAAARNSAPSRATAAATSAGTPPVDRASAVSRPGSASIDGSCTTAIRPSSSGCSHDEIPPS